MVEGFLEIGVRGKDRFFDGGRDVFPQVVDDSRQLCCQCHGVVIEGVE